MAKSVLARKRKGTDRLEELESEEFNGNLESILSDHESDDLASDNEDLGQEEADLISDADEDSDTLQSHDEDDIPYRIVKDAAGGERYEYTEIDPVYDSDDSDAQEATNTIGNIPLSFYDSYPHIGYDINGKKIMRPATGEALDALLDSIEIPKGWTGLTDPETGKPLNLSQDELELLKKIQMNEVPGENYDPYPVSCQFYW